MSVTNVTLFWRGEELESTSVPERKSQDRVGAGPWPGSPARQHCARARGRSRRGTDASGATRGRPDTDFAQGQRQKSHPFFFFFFIHSKPCIAHTPDAK